ncbi:MAG: hypothetical protein LIP77_01735 [Planctomycetes bacterium]|nr:hypothetical protein [Planctomycetota bacterium]
MDEQNNTNAGATGGSEEIALTGTGDTTPAGNTDPGPTAGSGSGADAGNPAPDQGVTLTGKDDTGTGEESGNGTGTGSEENGQEGGGTNEYVIKYPEGFKPLPEAEQSLRAHVTGKNLPPKEAAAETQALADLYVKTRQNENAALLAQLEDTKREWARELAADPEYGGANLAQTGKDANHGLRHYAPDLIPLLAEWNLERHPALVRHFAKLGRNLKENRSPRAEKPGHRRPKTLVDAKEEMLAREEAKARKA